MGHAVCFHCPRGKFAFAGGSGACSDCLPGTHSLAVAAQCTGCPAGRFQHLWGKHFCYGCPAGKFNGAVSATFCPSCAHCTASENAAPVCYSLLRDCRVSGWTAWGACDKTCHEGVARRTRSAVVTPLCDGLACPSLADSAICMLQPCSCAKVECAFEQHHTNSSAQVDNYDQFEVASGATPARVRVYHHKDERTFSHGGKQVLEGHHCKMAGGACSCRCHRMFRYAADPDAPAHYDCHAGRNPRFRSSCVATDRDYAVLPEVTP
jgi:hypothetical protein